MENSHNIKSHPWLQESGEFPCTEAVLFAKGWKMSFCCKMKMQICPPLGSSGQTQGLGLRLGPLPPPSIHRGWRVPGREDKTLDRPGGTQYPQQAWCHAHLSGVEERGVTLSAATLCVRHADTEGAHPGTHRYPQCELRDRGSGAPSSLGSQAPSSVQG